MKQNLSDNFSSAQQTIPPLPPEFYMILIKRQRNAIYQSLLDDVNYFLLSQWEFEKTEKSQTHRN